MGFVFVCFFFGWGGCLFCVCVFCCCFSLGINFTPRQGNALCHSKKISKKQSLHAKSCTSHPCLTFLHCNKVVLIFIPPRGKVTLNLLVFLILTELVKYNTNFMQLKQAERMSMITKIVDWSIKTIFGWRIQNLSSVQKCLKYYEVSFVL